MSLSAMRRAKPDELRADMQQYYGLDMDGMGRDHSVMHYATCAAQLPLGSRTMSALNPDASWGWTERLLSLIEYDLRVVAWQRTKDAQEGANRPKPPIEPGGVRTEPAVTREYMQAVADALGIAVDLDEGVDYGG